MLIPHHQVYLYVNKESRVRTFYRSCPGRWERWGEVRLRGAAVIHSPKLDDDILAKALDQLTAVRRRQEKHPFARRHFVRFSRDDYPVIRLARSLTSPSRTGTMDGLGRTASSFTLATTRTEAELRPYLLPSLAAAAVCLSAAAAAPGRPAAQSPRSAR